jgi:hypothetical protein
LTPNRAAGYDLRMVVEQTSLIEWTALEFGGGLLEAIAALLLAVLITFFKNPKVVLTGFEPLTAAAENKKRP